MAEGLGNQVAAEIMVDSTATLAVTQPRGNGKLCHVQIGQMWIQEFAEDHGIIFKKVKGGESPVDLGTKHLTRGKADALIEKKSLAEVSPFW